MNKRAVQHFTIAAAQVENAFDDTRRLNHHSHVAQSDDSHLQVCTLLPHPSQSAGTAIV